MINVTLKNGMTWFVAVLVVFSISACETVDSRIKENQAQFNTYSTDVKNTIRAAQVRKGFNESQVYMALGDPYLKDGETWTYAACHNKIFYTPYSEWEYRSKYEQALKQHNKRIAKGKKDIFIPPSRINEVTRCRHYVTRVIYFNDGKLTDDASQTGFVWLDPDYK